MVALRRLRIAPRLGTLVSKNNSQGAPALTSSMTSPKYRVEVKYPHSRTLGEVTRSKSCTRRTSAGCSRWHSAQSRVHLDICIVFQPRTPYNQEGKVSTPRHDTSKMHYAAPDIILPSGIEPYNVAPSPSFVFFIIAVSGASSPPDSPMRSPSDQPMAASILKPTFLSSIFAASCGDVDVCATGSQLSALTYASLTQDPTVGAPSSPWISRVANDRRQTTNAPCRPPRPRDASQETSPCPCPSHTHPGLPTCPSSPGA